MQGYPVISTDKFAVLLNMLTLPPPPEFYVSPRELIFYVPSPVPLNKGTNFSDRSFYEE